MTRRPRQAAQRDVAQRDVAQRDAPLRTAPERGAAPAPASRPPGARRKLVELDEETFHALALLGRDRFASFQDLADEAFADLLAKHQRPVTLRDALKRSAGKARAANDE